MNIVANYDHTNKCRVFLKEKDTTYSVIRSSLECDIKFKIK